MRSLAPKLLLWITMAVHAPFAAAQDFGFEPPATAADAALPEALRDLAERILPVYQDDDSDRYLANLAALQMVVGEAAAAHATRLSLRERLQGRQPASRVGPALVYDIYTQARAIEATESVPFEEAYARAFRETLAELPDVDAYALEAWLTTPIGQLREAVQTALDEHAGKTSIARDEALELMRAWFAFDAYRSFGTVVRPLLAEERERRYVVEEEIAIPVADGATIAATLVRPRSDASGGILPTVLEFTLDRSSRDAREAASHGYVSVLALARIAGDPQFRQPGPFESAADDARDVIDWIATQPWSDGRVGMQGHGYGGFVAWSAAKQAPDALRAIATIDPLAPGIDMPSPNRIFLSSAYRWLYDIMTPPGDKLADGDDDWRAFYEAWYRSGRSYRELPSLPGRASSVFRGWLNHPSYDAFWQQWLPLDEELARLDIPVLTITGYYSAGETAAMHYFTEHHANKAEANHALLIGPFDGESAEHGASAMLRELPVDPVARMDPDDARYAWFDYALDGAERPALLAANVNYQLAGTNEWRHEESLAALESSARRFYLAAGEGVGHQSLAAQQPATPLALTESIDLRERSDAAWRPARELVRLEVEPREGTVFVTEPLAEAVDFAGRVRGVLDFTINKYDTDLVMSLYELRPNGEYVKLFDPAYAFRASYARDRSSRRLLLNSVRQQLPFQSERMVGRRLEAGSRLALVLGINKRADQQINYGSTQDVGEASLANAGVPMRIRWHEGTYIELPAQ